MPKKKGETLGAVIGYPGAAQTADSPSPQALAGALAQQYAARANGGPAPQPSPQTNPHMLAMQQAAEAARQRYMLENGVDENGNPTSK